MSKIKNYLIVFCALFLVAFVWSTVKRANDFERKYLETKTELSNANRLKSEMIEAQKESILNQHSLRQRLAILRDKNEILNKHYDALKGSYKCERPAEVERVLIQGVCDYAESTGGGCK